MICRELYCLRDLYCAIIAYYRCALSKNWEDYYEICMHLLWHALNHALAIALCATQFTISKYLSQACSLRWCGDSSYASPSSNIDTSIITFNSYFFPPFYCLVFPIFRGKTALLESNVNRIACVSHVSNPFFIHNHICHTLH